MDRLDKPVEGLINYLMEHKHGSPFEHGSATFRIEAPIFVFREFHRHRIGWSYNEMSGRYTQLRPRFYVPDDNRPLVQGGTSARPKLMPGEPHHIELVQRRQRELYEAAWEAYEAQLAQGVAKEVARNVLPVGIFTEMYATANPRSIMKFLELRLADNAQYEIRMVAHAIAYLFKQHWPVTYDAWLSNGKIAP
jgi:thymidylate synthase (FAD)